jgi:hypothetical protein
MALADDARCVASLASDGRIAVHRLDDADALCASTPWRFKDVVPERLLAVACAPTSPLCAIATAENENVQLHISSGGSMPVACSQKEISSGGSFFSLSFASNAAILLGCGSRLLLLSVEDLVTLAWTSLDRFEMISQICCSYDGVFAAALLPSRIDVFQITNSRSNMLNHISAKPVPVHSNDHRLHITVDGTLLFMSNYEVHKSPLHCTEWSQRWVVDSRADIALHFERAVATVFEDGSIGLCNGHEQWCVGSVSSSGKRNRIQSMSECFLKLDPDHFHPPKRMRNMNQCDTVLPLMPVNRRMHKVSSVVVPSTILYLDLSGISYTAVQASASRHPSSSQRFTLSLNASSLLHTFQNKMLSLSSRRSG